MNTLYYGDNLKILREYIKDGSVDLIYLDPPFNSNRNYNVLFKSETGTEAESQITAFEDTWHWNASAEETYRELVLEGDSVGKMVESFRSFIGENQMMAYLVMMAIRLKELHRVLKPTGSLYLHCDPTASHYLKILLDTVFGAQNYRNEIVWKRTSSHNDSKKFGRVHDIILFYGKSERITFNTQKTPLNEEYVRKSYNKVDENGRRYRLDNISAPSGRGPIYEWGGKTQAWRYTKENMERLYMDGRIKLYPDGTAMINAYVRYLDENEGQPVQDWWDDVGVIAAPAKERLGYPTQKPVALLERILKASSNEGDIVLDPFCGCGTTIAAAQNLNRQWIGIDVTHLAVGLQKFRLKDTYDLTAGVDYKVIGQPEDIDGARELAQNDRYGFQWWVLPLIGARSLGAERGKREGKKGSDKGIDGTMTFIDDTSGKAKRVILSVKSGNVNVAHIRDLVGTIEREKAAIGVYVTLEPPTKPMVTEAVSAGFYHSDYFNKDYPRIQILTVEDILAGSGVKMPSESVAFKKAGKEGFSHKSQRSMFEGDDGE
ncbi:MAG TPA: DNA methyltransferase [Pyrinomonadaceae bacterium]|nr:DNA methyltransferase [Pyrinomonadaceae bacterium]